MAEQERIGVSQREAEGQTPSTPQTTNRTRGPRRNPPRSARNNNQAGHPGQVPDNRANTIDQTSLPTMASGGPPNRNPGINTNQTGSSVLDGGHRTRNTAMSTQRSSRNQQWRPQGTPQGQQQMPSQTDTEALTQAMANLRTGDSSQQAPPPTQPTQSRWRMAKPNRESRYEASGTSGISVTSKPSSHKRSQTSSRPQGFKRGEDPIRELLPRPKPLPTYLEKAQMPSRRLTNPKKLLIILDLNGTLLLRSSRGSNYTPRPHVEEFLSYCLSNHSVIVWSSARPHNVEAMVAKLFSPEDRAKLVKIWSREHLRLGKFFNERVQVYKQLTWLWEDAEVQSSFPAPDTALSRPEGDQEEPAATKWDQSNTVLLDDTIAKAASEPHNLLQIDEFTREIKEGGKDVVLNRVLAYIDDLKWEADVSAAMRERPFVMGEVKDEGAKEAKLETEV